jgi:murein DD-endopeptidase MepM/ murein hydrolase activator NlpD
MWRLRRFAKLLALQAIGSLILIGISYGVMQWQFGEEWVRRMFNQDVVATSWMNRFPDQLRVQSSLTGFLPIVQTTEGKLYPSGWYAPVKNGVVKRAFRKTGKGILIAVSRPSEVRAIGEGEVIFCAPPDALTMGWTVVIAHKNNAKSIYGLLNQASVRVGDHVKGGQSIGWISDEGNTPRNRLYFAFKQGELFLNPEAVIGFD